MNKYQVTYYYLATGMDGVADERYYTVYASTSHQAKLKIASELVSSDHDRAFIMSCLTVEEKDRLI